MLDHAREVASGFLYRTALHDVVDPTLHDERCGTLDRSVEASGDLVRSFAVDAVVPELEAGPPAGGPPQPLASLVRRVDRAAPDRIRIPERRARGDRIAAAGDGRQRGTRS